MQDRRRPRYKGHVSVDPDSEILVEAEVGAANQGDGEMMATLLAEFAQPAPAPPSEAGTRHPRPT